LLTLFAPVNFEKALFELALTKLISEHIIRALMKVLIDVIILVKIIVSSMS